MAIDDPPDDQTMFWEEEADNAVTRAIAKASVDELRGAITFPAESDDRFRHECTSFDGVVSYLEELYDRAWYAYVPFDSGEAVYEADSQGHVGNFLSDTDFEEFFNQVRDPDDTEPIVTSKDLIGSSIKSTILQLEFHDISKELIDYFAKNPEKLRQIDPYAFERLMAAVFRNRGFDVTLTPKSKDGGFDLMLLSRSDVGSGLTLVDCKRYAAHQKVGVEVVRGLYGTVEKQRATGGLIVTTSFFTRGAIDERNALKYRMALADFNEVKRLLQQVANVCRR